MTSRQKNLRKYALEASLDKKFEILEYYGMWCFMLKHQKTPIYQHMKTWRWNLSQSFKKFPVDQLPLRCLPSSDNEVQKRCFRKCKQITNTRVGLKTEYVTQRYGENLTWFSMTFTSFPMQLSASMQRIAYVS